jgi:HD-GYP domain-containing protein (c-di-GMP phosphodiesterase class II)
MRKIPLTEIKPGMILAKPIFNKDNGRILLPANFEIKPSYIDKIKNYNCSFIYIQNSEEEATREVIFKPIRDKTRAKTYIVLQKTIDRIQNKGDINPDEIHEVVDEIVNNILCNSRTIYNMFNIKSYDDYTFTHSVNVCVLSTLIGSVMGYNPNELEILATGALLHDIGKVMIDPAILNKPAKLSPAEFSEMKNHPLYGANLIQKTIPQGFLTGAIALQHHEREDGSGYPNGIDSKGIHPFSKIAAVADLFDAMTAERVYQKASPPIKAINELKSQMDKKYNRSVVEHFMKVVVPYPIGTNILLSNGEQVEVANIMPEEGLIRVKNRAGEFQELNINDLQDGMAG